MILLISAVLTPLLHKWWRIVALLGVVSTAFLIESLFGYVLLIAIFGVILHLEDSLKSIQLLILGAISLTILEAETLLHFIVGFEALSIVSFVLLSNFKSEEESSASINLFIMGAISSAIIFLGLALYSVGGGELYRAVTLTGELSYSGILLILLGLFYKFSLFPMHNWAVKSYSSGDPTDIAIISGVVKSVVVIATFQVLKPVLSEFSTILIILSIASMFLGNFSALFQTKLSKILAYSSIAQAGYMLLPFIAVESELSTDAVEYLVIAYIFMQTASFMMLKTLKVETLDDLKGLGSRSSLMALLFTVQLLSLGGIPLLAGFLSKAIAVYTVIDVNLWWFGLIALLNSALSLGYYSWIIKHIYFDSSKDNRVVEVSILDRSSQTILAVGTLFFGIFAGYVIG